MNIIHNLKSITLLIGLVCTVLTANSQTSETINTDRPGQAISPLTVGQGIFQLQTGFTLDGFDINRANLSGNGFQYTFNPRFGITEKFELNSIVALRSDNIESGVDESDIGGVSQLIVGARYNILDGSSSPMLAVQFDVALTAVSDDYAAEDASPRLLLTHSQSLTDWLSLTTNFGIVWNGDGDNNAGIYIVNLSFPLSDKIGGFVEAYASSSNGDFDINFDTGIGYLINDDLQLDISGGIGDNDGLTGWFVDAGLSWRIRPNAN